MNHINRITILDVKEYFHQCGGYIIFGSIAMSFAMKFLYMFLQSDVIGMPTAYSSWTTITGYTWKEFFCLLFGVILFPLGIISLTVGIHLTFKGAYHVYIKLICGYILFFATLIMSIAGFTRGYHTLRCGFIFCGLYTHHGAVDDDYNYGHASGQVFMGIIVYYVFFFFNVLLFCNIVLVHLHQNGYYIGSSVDTDMKKSIKKECMEDPNDVVVNSKNEKVGLSTLNDSTLHTHPNIEIFRKRQKYYPVYITFMIVFPIIVIACMSLPTWWAYLSLENILAYQQMIPPKEYGFYWSIHISNRVILKLFPDIVLYYGLIYVVVVVALTSEYVPALKLLLLKKLHVVFPSDSVILNALRINYIWEISVGELCLLAVITMMLLGQYLLFYFDHGWQMMSINSYTTQERAARSLGQMANICMALLIMPVARNNIWTLVFGVSWESMLIYHKYLGGLFISIVAMHMFTFWSVFQQQGSFPHDIFAIPTTFHTDNFTIPLITITFCGMMCLMIPFSNYFIRRSHYDLFYIAHHFYVIVFFAMLWHATMAWYFVIGSAILWICDHIIRLSNCIDNHVKVVKITTNGSKDVTELVYEVYQPGGDIWNSIINVLVSIGLLGPNNLNSYFNVSNDINTGNISTENGYQKSCYHPLHHEVGQYCFINIPDISMSEWHPFTISSCPGFDRYTTHHIKNMKDTEWTGKLYALAKEFDSGSHRSDRDTVIESREGKSIVELSLRKSELTADARNDRSDVHNSGFSSNNNHCRNFTNLLVRVDGPYGVPLNIDRYTHIALLAGGIGITPIIAYYRFLYMKRRHGCFRHIETVHLIWCTRNSEELELFSESVSNHIRT